MSQIENCVGNIEKTAKMIVLHQRGSHLFGLNTPTSDMDMGGLFRNDIDDLLQLQNPAGEISDHKHDITYYELKKFLNLACTNNPTVLETLWVPKECIQMKTNVYDRLIQDRSLFITKGCFFSYTGYAHAQIKRAKGKNKKVNFTDSYVNDNGITVLRSALSNGKISSEWVANRFNGDFLKFLLKDGLTVKLTDDVDWNRMDEILVDEPDVRSMLPPKRERFTSFVPINELNSVQHSLRIIKGDANLIGKDLDHISDDFWKSVVMPFRPRDPYFELSTVDLARVERMPTLYRVYMNGKGAFQGNMLTMTAISMRREIEDFIGVMWFNEDEYQLKKKEWESYFEWRANRNDSRWVDQETDKTHDMDMKNAMHTVRLLLEGEHILTHRNLSIRFDKSTTEFLMSIRRGEKTYDWLLKFSEEKMEDLRTRYNNSDLPNQVNAKKTNELYRELMTMELKDTTNK